MFRCGRRGSLGSLGGLGLGDVRQLQASLGRQPPPWHPLFREAWPPAGREYEGYQGYYGAHPGDYGPGDYRPDSRGWNHENYRNDDRGIYQYGDGGRRHDYREDYQQRDDYMDGVGSQGIGRPPPQGRSDYPVHYSNVRKGGRKYERETSTDEGENTSNDAGDISSSGESGSGRRRRRGRQSPALPSRQSPAPAPPTPSRPQRTQSAGPPSPKQRQESLVHKTHDRVESPRVKDNLLKDKQTDNLKSIEERKSSVEPVKAEASPTKDSPALLKRDAEIDAKEETHLKPEEQKEEKVTSKEELVDKTIPKTTRQVVGDTSDTSEPTQPLAPEAKEVLRRASLDRERKVGLGVPTPPVQAVLAAGAAEEKVTKTDAYQAMLAGARPSSQQVLTEESTSDDMEAEFAALAKTKSKLHSGGGGVHDEEADPFAETEEESSPAPARAREGSYEPAPTGIAGGGMGHMANLALSVGGGRGGLPGGRGGLLGGHGGLVGGRLAHPAAQKVGMMAVRESVTKFHIG